MLTAVILSKFESYWIVVACLDSTHSTHWNYVMAFLWFLWHAKMPRVWDGALGLRGDRHALACVGARCVLRSGCSPATRQPLSSCPCWGGNSIFPLPGIRECMLDTEPACCHAPGGHTVVSLLCHFSCTAFNGHTTQARGKGRGWGAFGPRGRAPAPSFQGRPGARTASLHRRPAAPPPPAFYRAVAAIAASSRGACCLRAHPCRHYTVSYLYCCRAASVRRAP